MTRVTRQRAKHDETLALYAQGKEAWNALDSRLVGAGSAHTAFAAATMKRMPHSRLPLAAAACYGRRP